MSQNFNSNSALERRLSDFAAAAKFAAEETRRTKPKETAGEELLLIKPVFDSQKRGTRK